MCIRDRHEDKHLAGQRLLYQVAEAAHVLLRHQADGRPAATDERPQPGGKVPYHADTQRDVLTIQLHCVRSRAVMLQSADILHFSGRQHRLLDVYKRQP